MLTTHPCSICHNEEFIKVSSVENDPHMKGDYAKLYDGNNKSEWSVCNECGFLQQNPRPTIEALNQYYKKSSYHFQISELSHELLFYSHKNLYNREIKYILNTTNLSSGSVFDIGCGYGFALNHFRTKGFECFGCEPDVNHFNYARDKLNLKGIKNDILGSHTESDKKYDLIYSHHAMEHFADLNDVMEGILNIAKVGSFIAISVPTYYSNKSRMSLDYMNCAHYNMFSHKSISLLMAKYGIEYFDHQYFNGKGINCTDDLIYIGRYTNNINLESYKEDGKVVSNYVLEVNPSRSKKYALTHSIKYYDLLNKLRVRYLISMIKFLFNRPIHFINIFTRAIARKIFGH